MSKNFYKFQNKNSASKSVDILMYGEVGDGWDTISSKKFARELKEHGDLDVINLYINSPGGSVFDGQAIYSCLKRNKAHVNVYVDGLAASIASVIAMAGDTVIMPSNSMMMIHKCWTSGRGNSSDFRKLADDLDRIGESIISSYEMKTGLDRETIAKIMEEETWLTAEQAVELGFADQIETELKVVASIKDKTLNVNGMTFDISGFKNMPENLCEKETVKDMTNQNPFSKAVTALKSFLSKDDINEIVKALEDKDTEEVIDGTETVNDAIIEEDGQPSGADESTESTVADGNETEVESESEAGEELEAELEAEEIEDTIEEETPVQEEEVIEDAIEEETEIETEVEETTEEETTPEAEITEEINAKIDLDSALQAQVAKLQAQIAELQESKAQADEAIAFNNFKSEITGKFANLVGTEDEIVNSLYALNKSNLDEAIKNFIFSNLEAKSEALAGLTEEVGTTEGQTMTVREEFEKKAKALADEKKITIEKARASLIESDKELYNALRAEQN